MLYRIRHKVETLIKPSPKRRELTLREPNLVPTDVFLASYPRSGNTWLRTIAAHLLYPHLDISALADLDQLVPDIHKWIEPLDKFPFSQPRVIKTHRPFGYRHEMQNPALYGKFIYIVRHPFNMMRSFFHYRFPDAMTAQNLEQHVKDVIFGLTIHGSWQENVLSWHFAAENAHALLLRYEDMQVDTANHIRKIAAFLDVDLPEERLPELLERTSRKYMIQMEEKARLQGDNTPEFVRREGKRRQLEHDLTPEQQDLICYYAQQAMSLYGYTRANED